MSDAQGSPASGRMALSSLWRIAWRDLGRNRRRSLLSMLAVALGLALLIALNGMINGVIDDMRDNAIRYETGHLQLRHPDYDADAASLRSSELVNDLDARLTRLRALDGMRAATPVLWMRGLLSGAEETVDLRLIGIDPASEIHAPFREAMISGNYLDADDRDAVLIGRRLAAKMGLAPGDKVQLAVVDAEGALDEGPFTVSGVFDTGLIVYDENTALMRLDKAQAFGQARGRASAIVMQLDRSEDAETVAARIDEPGFETLTWSALNPLLGFYLDTAKRFYWLLDAIVMLVVAVVIANTLLMAVFERIREMGILAALGMRGRQILQLFLLEALALGLAGCALGIALGLAAVGWMQVVGIDFGEEAMSSAGNLAISSVMHGRFDALQVILLSGWTLFVILLASLYPAWFAARMEPVDALRKT